MKTTLSISEADLRLLEMCLSFQLSNFDLLEFDNTEDCEISRSLVIHLRGRIRDFINRVYEL